MVAVFKRMGAEMFFERFTSLAKRNPPVPPDRRFEAQILAPPGVAAGGPETWQSFGRATVVH
jgi:hypothetical protein